MLLLLHSDVILIIQDDREIMTDPMDDGLLAVSMALTTAAKRDHLETQKAGAVLILILMCYDAEGKEPSRYLILGHQGHTICSSKWKSRLGPSTSTHSQQLPLHFLSEFFLP